MTTAQDIFDELKADHDRHRKLLDQLLETHGDSAERKRLFTELTKELKGHAAAEELVESLAALGLTAIYSSPYRRAIEPLAARLDLPIQEVEDLRERTLGFISNTPFE